MDMRELMKRVAREHRWNDWNFIVMAFRDDCSIECGKDMCMRWWLVYRRMRTQVIDGVVWL